MFLFRVSLIFLVVFFLSNNYTLFSQEIKRLNKSKVILELENDYLKIKKTIGLKNSSKEVAEYLIKSL